MKIFTPQQIREADNYTIENEPVQSIDLMERASKACVDWIVERFDTSKKFYIIAGLGNNGGDGLAIARLLHEKNYFVHVVILQHSENASEDFKFNHKRLLNIKNISVQAISDDVSFEATLSDINPDTIFIDAIFGSGISKPVTGWVAKVIHKINQLPNIKIAIDVPSGLFFEDNDSNIPENIVKANYTLSFELPKLAFMFAENAQYIGNWTLINIQWHPDVFSTTNVSNYFVEPSMLQPLIVPRQKFAHKGNFGHALIVAGSKGMMGAAVLSALAALRAGSGLVTTHIPNCGCNIMQQAVPEVLLSLDNEESFVANLPQLDKFNAIGIGPGIGKADSTSRLLKLLIQEAKTPLVLDADALNILSENKTWLSFLPPQSIITPHVKEFERLAGKTKNGYDRYILAKSFAQKYNLVVVLKGAHTLVATPDGNAYFNSTGNPGMATAGAGDVLTGIITGLLAQGYSSKVSAILGVFLHGLAGDMALQEQSQQSLIATDIIWHIGKAYQQIGIN